MTEMYSAGAITLEEMYRKHGATLYKIALRKLGNPADAEDAVQDGLLSAFTHMHQFRGDSRLSTWLTSIVLNAARMQLRRRTNHRWVPLEIRDDENDIALPELLKDEGPDPEEILRRAESREVLERIAAKLSPKVRLTFRLRVLDGLSIREAAEFTGTTDATIKARLFRAYRIIVPRLRRVFLSPEESRKNMATIRVKQASANNVSISAGRPRRRRSARKQRFLIASTPSGNRAGAGKQLQAGW